MKLKVCYDRGKTLVTSHEGSKTRARLTQLVAVAKETAFARTRSGVSSEA